ncbi:MAG: SRPBCC family protein [bacterium]
MLTRRVSLSGLALGSAYGFLARFLMDNERFGDAFGVMTLAFLVVVPVAMGVMTVSPVDAPSWRYRLFAPWVPTLLAVLGAMIVGWEGSICVYLGVPVLLLSASLGGIVGASRSAQRRGVQPMLALLPFIMAPLEQRIATPEKFEETVTTIEVAAPPAVVWRFVSSVDSIRKSERRPALFTTMGFPRPVSATLSRPGVGGVRRAEFEGGLVFTETVTDWQQDKRLSFTIRPNTASIPAATLDPHVTIGGPYFDVLTGTYELSATDGGKGTHLVLRSEHRVSTRFNLYAGWWAGRIMASIQQNILVIEKGRAEGTVP